MKKEKPKWTRGDSKKDKSTYFKPLELETNALYLTQREVKRGRGLSV